MQISKGERVLVPFEGTGIIVGAVDSLGNIEVRIEADQAVVVAYAPSLTLIGYPKRSTPIASDS